MAMKDYQVTIVPQEGYYPNQIAVKVMDYFDSTLEHDFSGETVLLKPSFVLPVDDERLTIAVDTNNAVIEGIARALSLRGAEKILIAEHRTIGPARYAFYTRGIKKNVKGIDNVKMCYLDEKKREEVQVEDPFIDGHVIKYPKMLVDGTVDYFISLPKLKTNIFAGVTLSVKNNFGLISKKERLKYHGEDLHANLADLELIRQPDLIITDAVIAGEGQGPEQPTPYRSEMLVISENPLACDTTCCYLMGWDPKEVKHLEMLHQRGIGPLDMEQIEVKNKEYLESKKKDFDRPDSKLEMTPRMKAFIGEEKACQGGCIGMVRGILDSYALVDGWNSLGNLNIVVGDVELSEEEIAFLKENKKRTLIYGECAEKYKKLGTYFKGCPPDYTKSLLKIWLRGPLGMNPHLTFQYVSPFKYFRAWFLYILQRIFRF